jgi:hypothetical protein
MKRLAIVFLVGLLACDTSEDAKPLPAIAGDWEHLFGFLEDVSITADSLYVGSSGSSYEQLNDSVLIANKSGVERTVYNRLFKNGELYFSYARSYFNNPLKLGRDSVVYELYDRVQ